MRLPDAAEQCEALHGVARRTGERDRDEQTDRVGGEHPADEANGVPLPTEGGSFLGESGHQALRRSSYARWSAAYWRSQSSATVSSAPAHCGSNCVPAPSAIIMIAEALVWAAR